MNTVYQRKTLNQQTNMRGCKPNAMKEEAKTEAKRENGNRSSPTTTTQKPETQIQITRTNTRPMVIAATCGESATRQTLHQVPPTTRLIQESETTRDFGSRPE